MAVNKGDKVVVEYEGKLDDGTIFDSTSRTGKPIEFVVGAGQVIPGFDRAVMGMDKGEEKSIKIESKDAYGEKNPGLRKEIQKSSIKTDRELKKGMPLILETPEGQRISIRIDEIKENSIIVDMNHPLSGQNLNFKIKVTDVIPSGQ
jgi:peptidylprolyl isomerase